MKVKEGIIKLKEKEINNWKSLGGNAQKPKQSKSVTLRKDKNKVYQMELRNQSRTG